MEQRTGKCLTSLSIVDKRKPKYLWIICPINAIEVWQREIKKHLIVDWDCKLLIMNFEELAARGKRRKYYERMKYIGSECFIIADELHKIKRRGSQASRALRHLAKMSRWRLGLTGTPQGQGIHDLWAQFDFSDPSVFGKFDSKIDDQTGRIVEEGFRDKYLIMGGFRGLKVLGTREDRQEEFLDKVHAHSFRVTLREARGKDKPLRLRYIQEEFDLDENTRKLYDDLNKDFLIEVNRKKVRVKVMIALIMKLQQLAGGFVKTEEGPEIVGSEKLRKLLKLAKQYHQRRKKFVVVCRFLYEIERIRARLQSRGISCQLVSGGRKYDHEFEEDCVIIQVQAGVAVDMAMADHMIFYSWDYSYLNHEQMRFRTLNFDKEWATFHYLIARGTIDEDIYQAVKRKKTLAQFVLDKYRNDKRGKNRTNSLGRL